MLAAFIFSESRATEPIIPLILFRDPVIAICSVCAFFLGVGMFGVIIYLPLFMQGVLRVSATQSGNLLTPLMMGAVAGSITGGQTVSRTGKYKAIAIAGSILVATGMAFFARMSADTTRLYVVYGMVIAGLGMGLLQPVYTIAVQNVAPRQADGRRDLVDDFLPVDRQHGGCGHVRVDDAHAVPRRVRAHDAGARARSGAAVLLQSAAARPGAAAARSRIRQPCPAAWSLLETLFVNVRTALESGLHLVFFWAAIIMGVSILLHLMLRSEPLRTRVTEPEMPSH